MPSFELNREGVAKKAEEAPYHAPIIKLAGKTRWYQPVLNFLSKLEGVEFVAFFIIPFVFSLIKNIFGGLFKKKSRQQPDAPEQIQNGPQQGARLADSTSPVNPGEFYAFDDSNRMTTVPLEDKGGRVVDEATSTIMYIGDEAKAYLLENKEFSGEVQILNASGKGKVSLTVKHKDKALLDQAGAIILQEMPGYTQEIEFNDVSGAEVVIHMRGPPQAWFKRFSSTNAFKNIKDQIGGFDESGVLWSIPGVTVLAAAARTNPWNKSEHSIWMSHSVVKGPKSVLSPVIGISKIEYPQDGVNVPYSSIFPTEVLHRHPVRDIDGQKASMQELYIVLEGTMGLVVGDSLVVLKPGDTFMTTPEIVHGIAAFNGPYRHLVAQLPSTFQYGLDFKEVIQKNGQNFMMSDWLNENSGRAQQVAGLMKSDKGGIFPLQSGLPAGQAGSRLAESEAKYNQSYILPLFESYLRGNTWAFDNEWMRQDLVKALQNDARATEFPETGNEQIRAFVWKESGDARIILINTGSNNDASEEIKGWLKGRAEFEQAILGSEDSNAIIAVEDATEGVEYGQYERAKLVNDGLSIILKNSRMVGATSPGVQVLRLVASGARLAEDGEHKVIESPFLTTLIGQDKTVREEYQSRLDKLIADGRFMAVIYETMRSQFHLAEEQINDAAIILHGDFLFTSKTDRSKDIDLIIVAPNSDMTGRGYAQWNPPAPGIPGTISIEIVGAERVMSRDYNGRAITFKINGTGTVLQGRELLLSLSKAVSEPDTISNADELITRGQEEKMTYLMSRGDLGNNDNRWKRPFEAYLYLKPLAEKYLSAERVSNFEEKVFGPTKLSGFYGSYYLGQVTPLPWKESDEQDKDRILLEDELPILVKELKTAMQGARLAFEATDTRIIVNMALPDAASFEAKKSQIVSSLGASLESRFDFVFSKDGTSKDSLASVRRDSLYIDESVSIEQTTTALIDMLVARQKQQMAAVQFMQNALTPGMGEDEAVEILRTELARIASELPSIGPLRVFMSSSGPVIMNEATLVDIANGLESGLMQLKTSAEPMKQALFTLAKAAFNQNAKALVEKIRSLDINLYGAALEAVADSKGPVTVLTDEAVLSKDDGSYAKEMGGIINRLSSRGTPVRSVLMVRADMTDPIAVALTKQEAIAEHAGYLEADILIVPQTIKDLAAVLSLYPKMNEAPIVAISDQDAFTAAKVETGGKEAIVLQVHQDAESLRQVPTVALILRLSSGGVTLPGLERTPEGVFIIKPLLLVLNELFKQLKTEQLSIGSSA